MKSGALTLDTFPHDMVRLACDKCRRRGQFSRVRLVERFGRNAAMPDVLRELAQCPDWWAMDRTCHAVYSDLR